jgi:sulfatase maturation enzyme AslB (radical SAM superfamily)
MIKQRIFPEHNYKGIHINGKTIRIALDPKKPISELRWPEFYDVKVTPYCEGNCPYCYQDSTDEAQHPNNIVEKFKSFFGPMTKNQKPFQIAFGGGEPTTHPQFSELMKVSSEMGIAPNYTTNGMWVASDKKYEILQTTKFYCGGVAVSTHPHLEEYWRAATHAYLEAGIFTNLHIIIGGRKSIDDFVKIYKEYHEKVKYFVLLPLTAQGRANEAEVDWDYFEKQVDGSPADIAFGANFYPYLCQTPGRFKVSLYEPEIMSGYLDLEDMKVYKSSFSSEEKIIGELV